MLDLKRSKVQRQRNIKEKKRKRKYLSIGRVFVAIFLAITLVACGGGAGPISGGLSVSGMVTQEGEGNMPLEGATVTLGSTTAQTGLDGTFKLEDINKGTHTVTAKLAGYTSDSVQVDVTADVTGLAFTLAPAGGTITPTGALATQLADLDGSDTTNTKQNISGNVSDLGFTMGTASVNSTFTPFDTALTLSQLQALVNGVVYDVRVDNSGGFNEDLPLNPGSNTIQLRVFATNGYAYVSSPVVVTADFDSLEMRILLRWDTLGDVDLHLFQRTAAEGNVVPSSRYDSDESFFVYDRHVWYSAKTPTDFGVGSQNPFLDIDDMTGYGPETIVMQQIPDGGDQKYHVWVHYFSMRNDVDATTAYVDIILNEEDRAAPMVRSFTKDLTEDWEYWYVTTINYPGGTFTHEPPAGY